MMQRHEIFAKVCECIEEVMQQDVPDLKEGVTFKDLGFEEYHYIEFSLAVAHLGVRLFAIQLERETITSGRFTLGNMVDLIKAKLDS